jgi:hypothetical protein
MARNPLEKKQCSLVEGGYKMQFLRYPSFPQIPSNLIQFRHATTLPIGLLDHFLAQNLVPR